MKIKVCVRIVGFQKYRFSRIRGGQNSSQPSVAAKLTYIITANIHLQLRLHVKIFIALVLFILGGQTGRVSSATANIGTVGQKKAQRALKQACNQHPELTGIFYSPAALTYNAVNAN